MLLANAQAFENLTHFKVQWSAKTLIWMIFCFSKRAISFALKLTVIPAGKVRHAFVKNCSIVKYFRIYTRKNCRFDNYFGIQLCNCDMKNVITSWNCTFSCICPNSYRNCEMSLFSKKGHKIWSFFRPGCAKCLFQEKRWWWLANFLLQIVYISYIA